MIFDLVVTRHPALVAHLRNLGLVTDETQIVDHVNADDVRGLNVCGVLPHSLSCLTKSFTEVPLAIPSNLRGVELTLDQVEIYSSDPITYRVFTEEDFDEGLTRVAKAAYSDGCCANVNWRGCF